MSIPRLSFDEPGRGLPRQLIPLRHAYLISGMGFRLFVDTLLCVRPTFEVEPLKVLEIDNEGVHRGVDPQDFRETLPQIIGDARLSSELIASISKRHVVWSDDFASCIEQILTNTVKQPVNMDALNWNPALHDFADLIEESYQIISQSQDTPGSQDMPRSPQQAATAELHARWRAEYVTLHERHPDKSDSWIATQIARDLEMSKGRSSETIRRNMKRGK